MGYRLLVGVASIFLLAGCAGLDTDNTPYEGMQPGDPVPGVATPGSLYSGYYSGDMTVESNSCASITDEVGAAVSLGVDVVQADATVEFIFEDGSKAAGTLNGADVTIMQDKLGVKQVYYLTFADEQITGSSETIEADANGQYGDPCATYSVAFTKGEKPADDEEAEVDEEAPKMHKLNFK